MKLTVNKKPSRLSMSSKKASKRSKKDDNDGEKKSQIRLPLWNKHDDTFYDHPFGKACFVVSDIIFLCKITKILNLEELFEMVSNANAVATKIQHTPTHLQNIKDIFVRVDPDLNCWHLYHTLFHLEAMKNKFNLEKKRLQQLQVEFEEADYTLNSDQENCRYNCWWGFLHFNYVNVSSHPVDLGSAYLSGIFEEVKKRSGYKTYIKLYNRQDLSTRESMLNVECQFWQTLMSNLGYCCGEDKDPDEEEHFVDVGGATSTTTPASTPTPGSTTTPGYGPASTTMAGSNPTCNPKKEKTAFKEFYSETFLEDDNVEFANLEYQTFGERKIVGVDRVVRFAQHEMAKARVNDENELLTLTFQHEVMKKQLQTLENNIRYLSEKIVVSRQNDLDLTRHMMSIYAKPKHAKHYLSSLDSKIALCKATWETIAAKARDDVSTQVSNNVIVPRRRKNPDRTKLHGGSSEDDCFTESDQEEDFNAGSDESEGEETPNEDGETPNEEEETPNVDSVVDDDALSKLRTSGRLRKKNNKNNSGEPIIIDGNENDDKLPAKKRKLEDTELPEEPYIGTSPVHNEPEKTDNTLKYSGSDGLEQGETSGEDYLNEGVDDSGIPKIDSDLGNSNLGNDNLGNSNLGKDDLGKNNLGDSNLGKDNLGKDNLGDSNLGKDDLGTSTINLGSSGNNTVLTTIVPGNLGSVPIDLESSNGNLEVPKDGGSDLGVVKKDSGFQEITDLVGEFVARCDGNADWVWVDSYYRKHTVLSQVPTAVAAFEARLARESL